MGTAQRDVTVRKKKQQQQQQQRSLPSRRTLLSERLEQATKLKAHPLNFIFFQSFFWS